jgi:putative tricarboxylic transport membrane protein
VRIGDTLLGGAFAVGGVAIIVATLHFPRQDGGAPGPGLFPQILALLMIAFGGGLAVTSMVGRGGAAEGATTHLGWRGVTNVLAVFAVIVFFMVGAPALGFLLTSAIVMFGLMWWLGTPSVRAALVAVGFTLFVYLVFGKVLRVPLPLGLLWF